LFDCIRQYGLDCFALRGLGLRRLGVPEAVLRHVPDSPKDPHRIVNKRTVGPGMIPEMTAERDEDVIQVANRTPQPSPVAWIIAGEVSSSNSYRRIARE
jgi:hypothetical protein